MRKLFPIFIVFCLFAEQSFSKTDNGTDDVFSSVPRLQIEIPAEGLATLRNYKQVWRQPRPERIDVPVTIREGGKVYTNVALHLKGSFSFAPIDAKPSLTLNFSKFADGQKFHGLTKIHLNNSVQDESYLCEQLARELFQSLGVPSPRAGHALVKINGRDVGLYVIIEGANKQFVKRHFDSTKGNLYDGGSGGDVTKALETDSGENPDDRTDLTNLVKAAREPIPAQRLARLEQVLDMERFITFAAAEIFMVHWDGYAAGPNNYRLFHDVSRDKMVFIPHGLDQLFGTSRSPSYPITPPFKGVVAKGLFAVPEGRRRYLARLNSLSTNEFRVEKLHAHVDRLAAQLRPALADHRDIRGDFEDGVRFLKQRITLRTQSVTQQLGTPRRPTPLAADHSVGLGSWSFKPGPTQPAHGSRTVTNNRPILSVRGRAPGSSGAWRTIVLLDAGHYEFTGRARTAGLTDADAKGTNGVILRMSGERSTQGITIGNEWTPLRYEFDVFGVEDVELICEFRGPQPAIGSFDAHSLRLVRTGSAITRPPMANE